ncbi:hypothetical protein JHK86_049757 [Glycine max]|nr:hypothetical protein JHK86_049757 [Glycine max]
MEVSVAEVEPFCGVKGEEEGVVELLTVAEVLFANSTNDDPATVGGHVGVAVSKEGNNHYGKRTRQVMLVKNLHTWKGLMNGATGTVVGFEEAMDVGDMYSDNRLPIVQFDSRKTLTLKPTEWQVMDRDKTVARRKQIPIILAWALSIHKCLRMTLDKAVINIYFVQ